MLTESQILMRRDSGYERIVFYAVEDVDRFFDDVGPSFAMDREDWVLMGRPEDIYVTVRPAGAN